MTENEIILYQPDEAVKLEVRLSEETVWLNRNQMAILFGRDVKTIGKHIINALAEELSGISTVANFATVQFEGGRRVTRNVEYYNLDMILSVGYRVKSQQGVLFRQWANRVLKEYLLKGYSVNKRFERLENRMAEAENKIDFFVRTSLPPVEGIFYDGQMLEPFAFVNNLIRSARKRIVLIDNYVDETVLLRLAERAKNVTAKIYTQQTSPSLNVALAQHNKQYEPIDLCIFTKSHDRFLIIDNDVYHIGASIKDLGKRWFAFCKMQLQADEMIAKLI
ncbi:MAG: virulence RhuM family protein [Salinivirgaceae bacterium]|nr:virulence RhuM family protein [Salinivirgaceae bacterium]